MDFVVGDGRGGARLRVKVQARASRNEIAGLHGEAVKVRVKAPPVGGSANEELLRFLAACLGVAPHNLLLVRGGSSSMKLLEIRGLSPQEVRDRLGL